jgi:mannose-6-phosphate isomerase-like protein (cupin superfamily)
VRAVSDERLRLSPNSTLEIKSSGDDVLEVEATYDAGGSPPPNHLHPAQDEHFEILEGSMRVISDGEERTLEVGEEIDIPRETAHQMWNPGAVPARVRWETRPRGRTEDFFRAVAEVMPDDGGMPDLARMLEIVQDFDDTFRLVTD